MADQQNSYTVPPAPQPPRRRLLRILPWSWTGLALALPYLLLILFVWFQDLGCEVQSGEWCGFVTFILTIPSSLLMTSLLNTFDAPGLLDGFTTAMLVPIVLNTLLVYLIGAALGWAATSIYRALR